jgi:hypothetical protein
MPWVSKELFLFVLEVIYGENNNRPTREEQIVALIQQIIIKSDTRKK